MARAVSRYWGSRAISSASRSRRRGGDPKFCSLTYDVTFPMFAKVEVNGPDAHPLYTFLNRAGPGSLGIGPIKWNFTKFLRTGMVRWWSAFRRWSNRRSWKCASKRCFDLILDPLDRFPASLRAKRSNPGPNCTHRIWIATAALPPRDDGCGSDQSDSLSNLVRDGLPLRMMQGKRAGAGREGAVIHVRKLHLEFQRLRFLLLRVRGQ